MAKAPGGTGRWKVGLRLEIWVREKVKLRKVAQGQIMKEL